MPPKAAKAAEPAKASPARKATPAAKAGAKAVAKASPAAKVGAPLATAAPVAKAGAKASQKPPAGAGRDYRAIDKGAAAAKALSAEKQAEDEEATKKKAEEMAEAEKTVEEERKAEELKKEEESAEAERKRKAEKATGDVVLKYNMYNEKFPIKDHSMTAAEIDGVYCLSDVMPGCKIHLSIKSVEQKYKLESAGEVFTYIFEEPMGTFHDLEAGETYFVFVEEDETEFLKSQEKSKAAFAGVESEKTRGEGCSCIEGNPCASECDAQGNSICLDWANRFAVAKANGWIGYQAK